MRAAEEIVAFERSVANRERDEYLKRIGAKSAHEATTHESPDKIIMAREAGSSEIVWEILRETAGRVFAFFAAKGPHPAKILLQIYRLASYVKIPDFSFTGFKCRLLLLDSTTTHQWLMQEILGHVDHSAILPREIEIQRALSRFEKRTRYQTEPKHAALEFVLPHNDDGSDEWELRRDAVTQIFAYITADGILAADILRLTFVLGTHMALKPFCEFTLREKKLLLSGSHGTHHWLMKKRGEDPLRRIGARAWKAPAAKTLKSRRSYSRAQQKNTNRKIKKR